jgi:hypothetical protein
MMNASPQQIETTDDRSLPIVVTEVALQEQSGDERINGNEGGISAGATVVALPMDMSETLRRQIEDLQRQSELGQYQDLVDVERALPSKHHVEGANATNGQRKNKRSGSTPLRGGDSESTAHSVNMALLVLALVIIIIGLIFALLSMVLKK